MALYLTAARAESLRDRIRRCRLPAPLNIFFFGFDPTGPEEDRLHSAPIQPSASPGVERASPPPRHRPQAPPPVTMDEIEQRLKTWAAGLEVFPDDIVMDELAARNQLHRNHLAKYFRHLGKDFRFWKLEKKVECACRLLLKYPEEPIGDIAVKAGFGNASNFFRQFHRLTGCTPAHWRNRRRPGGPD